MYRRFVIGLVKRRPTQPPASSKVICGPAGVRRRGGRTVSPQLGWGGNCLQRGAQRAVDPCRAGQSEVVLLLLADDLDT